MQSCALGFFLLCIVIPAQAGIQCFLYHCLSLPYLSRCSAAVKQNVVVSEGNSLGLLNSLNYRFAQTVLTIFLIPSY